MLSSAATKREARSYLSRYSPQKPSKQEPKITSRHVGVNLGSLYLPVRSIDESPTFIQAPEQPQFGDNRFGHIHVALVIIENLRSVEDLTLAGIGRTLSQLSRLGLKSVVVVRSSEQGTNCISSSLQEAITQADRVVQAIDQHGRPGARRLDSVVEMVSLDQGPAASIKLRGSLRVTNRKLLITPLKRGVIPVIAPLAFVPESQELRLLDADEIALALTRDLAGIQAETSYDEEPEQVAEKIGSLQKQVSIDRLIILDPLGGIPSSDQAHEAHVFINLEQEYTSIRKELLNLRSGTDDIAIFENMTTTAPKDHVLGTRLSNGVGSLPAPATNTPVQAMRAKNATSIKSHVKNLDLLNHALGLLPPTSSAIITTPQEAASPTSALSMPSSSPGVGTRRRRNPLIHNLLTDKPVFSSSLPVRPHGLSSAVSEAAHATFVKRGMPVTIIPDPRLCPWKPPTVSTPCIQLSDPRVDLARLVYLIEDSFNRTLDVSHYLSRISDRIAGVIICGNYEGGAILTWEAPFPGCQAEQMVPYLDKFAVLKRSQGAGGVADMIFKAMVGDCLPDGVCWRSRRDNPVNKWYFERSKGTWKMPNSNWTMFWTTDDVEANDDRGVFGDYAKVCRNVVPSWADKKGFVD